MNERKEKRKSLPAHETFRAAMLLALVGGFLDAYTYLLKGGVFANAQTGNLVLLGVRFAEKQYMSALYYLIPIMAFSAGVLFTATVRRYFDAQEYKRFEHHIIIIEIIILTIIGFLPSSIPNGIINVTISFVCSLQVNSFPKMKGMPYASTMCTGNLRAGMEKLTRYITTGEKVDFDGFVHYMGIILFFVAGAFSGSILIHIFAEKSIWCCCILLMSVLFLLLQKPRPSGD